MIQLIIDSGESFLQPIDMGPQAGADIVVGLGEPVVLCSKDLDKLTAAREKIARLAGLPVRKGSYLRFYPGSEESQYPGVNSVLS